MSLSAVSPLDPRKFQDPFVTTKGERPAVTQPFWLGDNLEEAHASASNPV